jgi:hypothetical protein
VSRHARRVPPSWGWAAFLLSLAVFSAVVYGIVRMWSA